MENSINCHGKVIEFYYQISVGTLNRSFKKAARIRNERIQGQQKWEKSQRKSRKEAELVWTRDVKRGGLIREKGDGNGSTIEEEGRKA